jgi:Bacterial antitoxin of type II TA system, VapB
MVTHMKTTIEISDGLLRQVKALAQREGTTVRALVEAGLRGLLKEHRERPKFVLRDGSFAGEGLAEGARAEGWESLRDTIYEGRGS